MNIFTIPSWYPSHENPIYGTFVKEQIEMLSLENPDWNFGISLWGQGRPSHMLPIRDHFLNLGKFAQSRKFQAYSDQRKNVTHLYTPAVTWTRKIVDGNLAGIIRSNDKNLSFFKKNVGPVDIIHAQASSPAALVAQSLSEKYKIPYVVSIRMSPFPFDEFLTTSGRLRSLISKPLQNANALIATSSSLKKRMEFFGLSKVQVIHNPVDTDFFQPSNDQSDDLTILTVGRLEDQKGIDILLEAVALLGDRFLGKLRIGGEGSQKHIYQKLSHEKGIEDKIEWLGELTREQVRDEMHHCSFYVLPSRHETFGNVLPEAIACGKPVVATKCGGPQDIVTSKVGLLCEVENTEDLVRKISQMIEKRETFHANGLRKYVLDKFSSKTFSGQVEKLYSSLVAS